MSLYNYVPSKEHLVQLMIDHVGAEYRYPSPPPAGGPAAEPRAAILELARQGRDITRRHPWLPRVMQRPPVIGPSALRYVEYFLGLLDSSGLDTGAKMEILAMVNGFAISYGGAAAALAEERARTGVTEEEQAAAQVAGLVSAAASGSYPNLAAALAAAPAATAGRGRDLRPLRAEADRRGAGPPARDRSPEGGTDPPRGVMTPG